MGTENITNSPPLTFGSLFAGIGGMDLGLERAGLRCVWQVEIDDYAQKILQKHWPNVPRWDDVRTFPPDSWRTAAPDLICGGFPCQDISRAGKKAGINGERSGLWSEFSRIIRVLRPRIVVVENVSDLLVRGIDTVLGDLAQSGYDAEWDCLPAGFFGAPHLRARIFLVAFMPDERKRILHTRSREQKETSANSCSLRKKGDCTNSGGELLEKSTFFQQGCLERQSRWRTDQPGVARASYGTPHRVDRIRCIGNAVVPQVAEWIGKRIIDVFGGPPRAPVAPNTDCASNP